jgi:hypothetical protein
MTMVNRLVLLPLVAAAGTGAVLLAGCSGDSDANGGRSSVQSAPVPTVACDEAIGHEKSGRLDGYRIVLGVVSVPPPYLTQVVPTGSQPWRYWRKAGLGIRAGSRPAVMVSVPKAWRKRVAITWGSTGTVGALRIGRCPPPRTAWYGYAGGFYIRFPSACVPLIFRVGQRTGTVRFGLGRPCPAKG